ncbi:hypothetical protein [Streptomyces uncialis]|uniref:hypothetical protein n=1 Tax=Streptomyces uncialis TaxID=1048205 RepID=UPI00225C2146|nr:hypothetical protein [Streptomyces uncialis]MCX4659068.1 hypothetical protein [Streptomyces uncialis]WST66329.1 hypothetical protein OG268_01615 [Streptomyces uncialis]
MDEERARRMVEQLRAREVMAHLVEAGVYEFGIRVVIDGGIEALWDVDGAAGLDAEIVDEGTLIGFVPHVPGSENFTEQQLVDTIATTNYSTEGLHPPTDTSPGPPPPGPVAPAPPDGGGLPYPDAPPPARHQRRAHWFRRGGR